MIVGAMRLRLALIPILLLTVACGGGPPPPAPAATSAAEDALAPLSSHGSAPLAPAPTPDAVDRPDPTEAGIGELARLARYVFREMGERQGSCRLVNPLHDRLAFTLRIEVKRGRMRSLAIASARVEGGGSQPSPLPEAQWPDGLRSYVACLEPFLKALRMDPAPADEVYDADYSFGGHGG
jgi:hypothetical protein